MTPAAKMKAKIQPIAFLRALKPLLLLIIPAILLVVSAFLIKERSLEIAKWVDYTAYSIGGLICLWTLIRLAFFGREAFVLWSHDRELMRKDPLFVVETKIRERLGEIHQKIKQTGNKIYDVPFFAVMGPNSEAIKPLLDGSTLSFPKDLNLDHNEEAREGVEKWYVGSEAVFVDTSQLQSIQYESHWKLFLKTLGKARSRAPINGAVIVLPVRYFSEEKGPDKKEYEIKLQENLQLMQEMLQEKFPVYVIVSGIDQIPGFEEFFSDQHVAVRGQILGWSAGESALASVDLKKLGEGILHIEKKFQSMLLSKMGKQQNVQNVDRVYSFNSKFGTLLGKTEKTISTVFGPDNYLDPVPFRGVYFTGGPYLNLPSVPAGPVMGGTVVGSGSDMGSNAPTILGSGQDIDSNGVSHNWFCRDFFFKKLLLEAGNIVRPKRVLKNQRTIRYATAGIIALQIIVSVVLIVSEAGDTANWRQDSEEVLRRAQALLSRPVASSVDKEEAGRILEDIIGAQAMLKNKNLFRGATSFGLDDDAYENLAAVHNAIMQKFFLSRLIKQTENDISSWDGHDKDFRSFAEKLIEYVRWANPNYRGDLGIAPFLAGTPTGESTKERDFLLKHFAANKMATKPELVDKNVVPRISGAIVRINGASRITVPLESGAIERNPAESEWEWWQRFSRTINEFSKNLEQLLKVEAPITGSENKDPTDQIFEATKLVEYLMNGLEEISRLKEEGIKNYNTWTAAMDGYSEALEAAAVNWQVILKELEKSRARNEYGFKEVVEPVLDKEMHWVQPIIGVEAGHLTEMLDNLVKTKTKMSSRDADLYKTIGEKVFSFVTAFNEYLAGIGVLIKKSGALVSYSTYYSGEELMQKLQAASKEIGELAGKEQIVGESAASVNVIAEEVRKHDMNMTGKQAALGLKDDPGATAKKLVGNATGDIPVKKEILQKFRWNEMSSWIGQWQGGLKREKIYLASLYWMELFDWYKPIRKDQLGKNWHAIVNKNTSALFVEDIAKFLDGWLESIPSELKASLSKEGEAAPEIKDFIVLYNQVKKFKDVYLPGLRKASSDFVSAVHAMGPVANKSRQKMQEAVDPDLNWDALQAFSKFKEEYEINEGIALRNITGSLEELEVGVQKGFKGQLKRDFNTKWGKLIGKMKRNSSYKKFPFLKNGASAERSRMMEILTSAVELGIEFGLLNPEDESVMDTRGQSGNLVDTAIFPGRRNFIIRCAGFKKLFGDSGQAPELSIKMVSGDIGRYFHWVRMYVGNNNFFDMSVYGDRETKLNVLNNPGGIKFVGLDVGKNALSEKTLNKGELGLLQFTYNYGRSLDKQRTKWRIRSQIGSAGGSGEQVGFEMIFAFTQSLPELPVLPE